MNAATLSGFCGVCVARNWQAIDGEFDGSVG